MKVTIYAGSLNKEYVKAFYYLEKNRKIEKLNYFGTNPLYYTFSKLKNFKNYSFKDVFNSYIAPFKLLFTKDILIISITPYSYKIIFPLILIKLKKKIIFEHSWSYFDNPNIGIINPNSLKLKLWRNFLSKVPSIMSTKAALNSLKNIDCKAYHIPHCINLELFESKKTNNKKIKILYVGRLVEEKGIKELLEIFSRFNTQEVELIIVGKGRLDKYVKLKQKELPITYLGHISDKKELANIYINSNIFVLNSYRTNKWEEFFGITLLEAMAAKLPIVATDCVGPKELVINGKNGFLVKQKDSENFYKSLKILVENPKIRNKMGEAGRKIVENYSIEKVSMELYKILDRIK